MDAYAVLGVKRTDDKATIKKKYLAMCKQYHPDNGGDPETFMKIRQSWEEISENRISAVQYRSLYHKSVFDGGVV